jgi:molecular chaperone GrpE (heat shock protein)
MPPPGPHQRPKIRRSVPAREDIDSVAGQLASLTRTVAEMAEQLKMLRGRADTQQEQSAIQQERIDLTARELTEVSDRLQAAANALRQSI